MICSKLRDIWQHGSNSTRYYVIFVVVVVVVIVVVVVVTSWILTLHEYVLWYDLQ